MPGRGTIQVVLSANGEDRAMDIGAIDLAGLSTTEAHSGKGQWR
jgi:hypothetical protein